MKNLLFLYFVLFAFPVLKAQYDYYSIPDSLKKNADYIILENHLEYRVINPGEAIEKRTFAVVINSQYSNLYKNVPIEYSKNVKINSLSGAVYDAHGKRVKKLKGSDITDVSSVSGASLYEDSRRKILHFAPARIPYIITFQYERTLDGILRYPTWFFQTGFNESVLSSKLSFIIPDGIEFKYKEFNLQNKVKVTELNGAKQYVWEEKNLVAKRHRELLPSPENYMPVIYLAPVNFKVDDYEGSMKTWSDFSKWCYELNKGRDVIPLETYEHIKDLVKDAKSDIEKAQILYEYMQNKTRYVSVQLGIGGFQTFPAEYVDTKGYGDCKALTNYMYTLLKKVGVKSYYAWVKAGDDEQDIMTDFPSNQFNHVILCIPQEKDTVWLECTSQQQPFGFLGTFTDNRHALLIDENGGKLAKTTSYGKEVNKQIRTASVVVDAAGDAVISVKTVFQGLDFESRFGIEEYAPEDQRKVLNKIYDLSGMSLKSINYAVDKSRIPSITEELELDAVKFASMSSKRMFIKLNLFSGTVNVPERNENRKLPFEIKRGYTEIDSIHIKIPEGYKLEAAPKEKKYDTKFGFYHSLVTQANNEIIYVRKLIVNSGFYPASDYQNFYDIRKKIKRADKAKLVLVKE